MVKCLRPLSAGRRRSGVLEVDIQRQNALLERWNIRLSGCEDIRYISFTMAEICIEILV
jgi:hypothetical protein